MKTEQPDEAIVEEFKKTLDPSLFKLLIRRYQNRIFNSAYRMLGSREEAEEVVQETFLKMHQNLGSFRAEASFNSWIFRICHNVCVDVLRTRQRRRGITVVSFNSRSAGDDGEGDSFVHQVADDRPEPQRILDMKEEGAMVAECLQKLPDSQRAVLVLHDIDGFSYQEIADIVGEKIGTVRSRLHYGRLKLKELMDPYYTGQPAASR